MGIKVAQAEYKTVLAREVLRLGVCIALMGLTSCSAITPSSYLVLEPLADVMDVQDPNRANAARPRSGPRYVQVSLGREERWKIGSSKEAAKIKELIGPELERRGWCPDSYDILEKAVGGGGDLGIIFLIKCK